jgi:hypothetical protein
MHIIKQISKIMLIVCLMFALQSHCMNLEEITLEVQQKEQQEFDAELKAYNEKIAALAKEHGVNTPSALFKDLSTIQTNGLETYEGYMPLALDNYYVIHCMKSPSSKISCWSFTRFNSKPQPLSPLWFDVVKKAYGNSKKNKKDYKFEKKS